MGARYTETDCIGSIQLTGWAYGKSATELKKKEYAYFGFRPSSRTITRRFGSWQEATIQAEKQPQAIPSHLPFYFQAIATLRRTRDLHGQPVTGFEYRACDHEIPYREIVNEFGSWTRAKIIARIHTSGESPWEGLKPMRDKNNSFG